MYLREVATLAQFVLLYGEVDQAVGSVLQELLAVVVLFLKRLPKLDMQVPFLTRYQRDPMFFFRVVELAEDPPEGLDDGGKLDLLASVLSPDCVNSEWRDHGKNGMLPIGRVKNVIVLLRNSNEALLQGVA